MTKQISVNVGGLWRTDVAIEEGATWGNLKIQIKKATGMPTHNQILTPTGKCDERCELEEGDDVFCDWKLSHGYHPLHFAASDGNIKAIQSWVANCADINVTNVFGVTPLICAVNRLKSKNVAELLRLGACAKFVDKNGNIVLNHLSCFCCDHIDEMKKIVKMVIKAGCDPATSNNNGWRFIDVMKRCFGNGFATEVESWIKEASGEACD